MTPSWTALLVATVVSVLGSSHALRIPGLVLSVGKCPTVPTKPGFVLNSYLGQWFSYEQFDAPFQYKSTCVRARYSLNPDGSIQVINDGYTEHRYFGILFGREETEAIGRATIPNPSKPAELKVQFGSQPDFGDDGANYLIVDTDYSTYSLVYTCNEFLFFKFEIAWVLTRQRGQRPANLAALENRLSSLGVDTSNFKLVRHNDCQNNDV